MELESGTIFLSHTASDKHFVEQVYNKLYASSTFYDIRTVEPGQSFIDAMKAGTTGKDLFVLFHSPNTKNVWVDYETRLAEVHHASNLGRILVIPIGGETYKTPPGWMTSFMTCTEQFTISDVARPIQYLQSQLIGEVTGEQQVIVGREDLLRLAHMQLLKNVQTTGSALQHIVFSGLSGMGSQDICQPIHDQVYERIA